MCDTSKGKGKKKCPTIGQLAAQQRVEKGEELVQTSSASLAVQVKQALMSSDVQKLDGILRESKINVIQATLLDLHVSHVVPLLKALFERVNNRSAVNIKPWMLWIQCIISFHSSYLSSMRNLEVELAGLLDWMRQRVGHLQKLLELHGRLSVVGEQIERRMNRTVVLSPQPLIVFNDDVDSDLEDIESGGSDESGASSDEEEQDWWNEGGLSNDDESVNGDEDDSDDGSEIDIPEKRIRGGSDDSEENEDEHVEEGDCDGHENEDEMDIG